MCPRRLAIAALLAITPLLACPERAAAACGAGGTPTTTVYLPNITRTLGGPSGWVTPFIVQNVGASSATLEVAFYRFSDGALIACRSVPELRPSTSLADVPNEDADLPDDTQFSVVVRSFGSPVVAVVNEQQGSGDRAEALSYDGLSVGATTVWLPYVAKAAGGWLTTFVVQDLGAAAANVTVSLTTAGGTPGPVLRRVVAPGRSQAFDPAFEPSVPSGEYSATVTADQPVAVIVNAHNDAPTVAAPRAFSYNGLAAPAAYLPYVARNTDGVARQTRVVVQNTSGAAATPTLTFRQLGGSAPVTITASAALAPGAAWSFDPRYLADGITPCPPSGSSACVAEGEHSVVVSGGAFAAIAIVASPATALGYAATTAATSRLYLPNVTRTLGGPLGWTTPILVQSAGATSATLRWYRFADGQLALTQTVTGLTPGAGLRVDPRQVSGLAEATQYAVVVDGSGPLTVIVTELSFTGGDGAMAYEGIPASTPAATAARDTLGMNVDYVADWITALPFVDVIKSSRAWTSQAPGMAWGMGGPLDLDDQGWIRSLRPGQYGEIVMLTVDGHHPVGDYTLLYRGQGTLEFVGDQVTVRSREPGRWVVHVESGHGSVFLRETATEPADPIRDIRFVMPGFEATYATQPFHPLFLDRLRPFNVIRFLDWMVSNGSPYQPGSMPTWSVRPRPEKAFQSDGVALEHMIRLSNVLHAEPWFTLPHDLDDDGVRRSAMMVRDQLDPSLKVWVEYSNETWNSAYPQSSYVQDRGVALGLATDRLEAGERYTGLRSAQIFAIWQSVFGSHERMIRVISSQFTVPTWTALPLIAANGPGGADALAMGAYFDCMPELLDTPAGAAQVKAMSDDAVLDRCQSDIAGTTRGYIQQNLDIARRNGLRLVGYEGGQGLVGVGPVVDDAEITAKLTRVNRMPRMYDLYIRFLTQWRDLVGDQLNHLSFSEMHSKYGSWGAMEWLDQDVSAAPKYRALLDMLPSMNPGR